MHVRIKSDDGLTTIYAHLSVLAPELKKGSKVDKATALGLDGTTGNPIGDHLHKERYV